MGVSRVSPGFVAGKTAANAVRLIKSTRRKRASLKSRHVLRRFCRAFRPQTIACWKRSAANRWLASCLPVPDKLPEGARPGEDADNRTARAVKLKNAQKGHQQRIKAENFSAVIDSRCSALATESP